MAFDPSIISSIPDSQFDPVAAKQKALGIKDMMDRQQLSHLQLGEAQKQQKEQGEVEAILKQSDYTTPEGLAKTAAAVNKVSPRASMDLLKTGQQYQSGQIQQQLDQLTLMTQRQDMIVSAIDPIVAQARQMKNGGASDLDVKAYITQQMPGALQSLRQLTLSDGKPALPDDQLKMAANAPRDLATLEGWESRSKAGAAAIKQRLDQFKADTQAKGERNRERTEDERERADLARESIARQKQQAREFGGKEGELLGALADRGVSLPAGLRSQAQMKATLSALLGRHPDLNPDQIAEGIERGQIAFGAERKETQIAAGIAGKIRYAEEEITRLVPLVKQASDNLPRGAFVPWSKLKQYGEAKLSDPDLKKFKSYMTTLSNAYDVLAARGGTDIEKRKHNREMFDTADSPEALQAVLDAVLTEAHVSGEAAQASEQPRLVNPPAAASPGAGGPPPQPPPGSATPPASGGAPKVVQWNDLQ